MTHHDSFRFLNGQVCKLTDCMYLHEVAEEEASFTKEDMSKQKHSGMNHHLLISHHIMTHYD